MILTVKNRKVTLDNTVLAFQEDNKVTTITTNIEDAPTGTYLYKLDLIYANGLTNIIDLNVSGSSGNVVVTDDMLPVNGKCMAQIRRIGSDESVYHTDTFNFWIKYSIVDAETYNPVPSEFLQSEARIEELNAHPPKPDNDGEHWDLWNVQTHQYVKSTIPLPSFTSAVQSVNGKVGHVTLNATDVGAQPTLVSGTNIKTINNQSILGSGNLQIDGGVISINGKTGVVTLKTSDLQNDSRYITNAVNNLINYRLTTAQDIIDQELQEAIDAIDELIPSQASSSNQLADKEFVNSSISTETAHYISNNGQPFTSLAQLETYSGTVTNNDYAMVTGVDESGNTYYDRYKATVPKPAEASSIWAKEYRLNNSSFTAVQWAAVNSGITATLKASYDAHLANTNNPHSVTKTQVGLGNVGNYKAVSTEANQSLTSTEQSNARTNIGAGTIIGEGTESVSPVEIDADKLQSHPASYFATASALDGKEDARIIKTVMDSVATANADYFLGEQTTVAITMPTDASVGAEILVCFTSGETACTLTCDLQGFSFVPKANKTSWIKFTLYHKADVQVVGDTDLWLVETKEG